MNQPLIGDKTASDMVTPDTKVLIDGTVVGELKYISDYKDFSNNPEEQKGNFFPTVLGDKYKGKEITCTGIKNGGVTKEVDTEWVLRVSSQESGFKFECDDEEIITLRFKEATLNGPVVIPPLDTDLGKANGGKTVLNLIGADVKISWDGTTGKPTGKIKNVEKYDTYPDGQRNGHYFPVQFSEQYYDKELHVGGSLSGDEFTAGSNFTPNKDDPYLVIRIENCTDGNKVKVFDVSTKEELFTIDFSAAKLL